MCDYTEEQIAEMHAALPSKPNKRVYLHPDTQEFWIPISQANEFSTFNFETGVRRGRELANEELRAAVEDAVDTLEAMDLHTDNALYDRLRAVLEQNN